MRPAEPMPAVITRVRTGLVVLAAVLTEIVVIAAIGNQWVTKHIADSIQQDQLRRAGSASAGFGTDFKTALLTYNWRFAPQSGDHQNVLLSQVLLILATVVISALLIAVVVRGPGSFGQAFFASWMAVVVATLLGAYLRGYVNTIFRRSAAQAMFGALGPNAFTFLAALMLGLIVGLVAGAVAMTTRRTVRLVAPAPPPLPQYVPPEQPPPYYGERPRTAADHPQWHDQHYGPPAPSAPPRDADQPTTALPTVPRDDGPGDATAQLPSLRKEEQSPPEEDPGRRPS
jgi:hypothetical protein